MIQLQSLSQVKHLLKMDEHFYDCLRHALRRRNVVPPPQNGKILITQQHIEGIAEYLKQKSELYYNRLMELLTENDNKKSEHNPATEQKVELLNLSDFSTALGLKPSDPEAKWIAEKLKNIKLLRTYGTGYSCVKLFVPSPAAVDAIAPYLKKRRNIQRKNIENAILKVKNQKTIELIEVLTRVNAADQYKNAYNSLRDKGVIIKASETGYRVRIRLEHLGYVKNYLKNKNPRAAERIDKIFEIQPLPSGQKTSRPKKTHSELTQMESLVDIAFRKEKIMIRKILLSEIRQYNPISLLSFPGLTWFFERDLIAVTEKSQISQIVGLERNRNVYQYMVMNKPPEKPYIQTFNTTDYDFALNPPQAVKPFNFVWLDYMGAFSFKKLETFKLMLKNNLFSFPATLALTFQAGLEYQDVLKYYTEITGIQPARRGSKKDFRAIRLAALPLIYTNAAKQYSISCYEIMKREYIEPSRMCHHAPMILLLFRLEK